MAKAFETWTVLAHKPIEKLADNLWRVSGTMPNGRVQRQMVLARMGDGRVVVHNAIALGEEEMRQIEEWGTPAVLIVPNGFHRQDAAIWKKRYPKVTVVAPAGARKRVEQVVPVDMTAAQAPADDQVRLVPLDGVPSEIALEVRSGGDVSLVFCDVVLNMSPRRGPMGFVLGPTGRVSVPRFARWFLVKDRRAFAGHLERLAATPGLRRLLFGHGRPIMDGAAEALRGASSELS